LVEADAGDWVAQPAQRSMANVLNVDLYDHEAAAPVLDSAVFYRHCRDVLAPGGVMSVNLFGRASSFEASAERIVTAFGAGQVWRLQATREGNTVVIATNGVVVPEREELLARAATIEHRFGLPARKWLKMVRPC
jgi:spermidine synthase